MELELQVAVGLSMTVLRMNLGPLEEQQILLTATPPLHSLAILEPWSYTAYTGMYPRMILTLISYLCLQTTGTKSMDQHAHLWCMETNQGFMHTSTPNLVIPDWPELE